MHENSFDIRFMWNAANINNALRIHIHQKQTEKGGTETGGSQPRCEVSSAF